ncbi:pseudouridine synthase [Acetonema longum]|uniref:Pseudouridine synthase n=1 Tax=Acetonema longum DSM 6540 TaxID=1009370 RepID=F7NK22_9FIRM|nr:pseudouridine synthase [Acetonema longum]EGO63669.1 Pseudouridine synthase [Acetonema longum DSM 6540]
MTERLQKVLSQAGVASRRQAEQYILEGRVSVNGKVIKELGTKVTPGKDRIRVDGKIIGAEKLVYILLYKPKGVVSTMSDPEGRKTVKSLVEDIPERIYPVGRLDYNTEGLLLMTNDGELAQALTHPSHEIEKTYLARVLGQPAEEKLDRLRIGIRLEDGVTAPAKLILLEHDREKNITQVEIIIHEGKNRQVRRMFEAIGHPVNQLKRVSFAFLTLQGVRRGRYRHLTTAEVQQLKSLSR